MGGGKKAETMVVGDPMARSGDPNFPGFRLKNMHKSDLAGVIFGCKHSTISECLTKQIFGLPGHHSCYVKNIEPGMPLFLFNYSDRMLHGIYEAAGHGQLNIDPYAWTDEGNEKTPFPAQVRICLKNYCLPIPEKLFGQIIKENYFSEKHFYFELDQRQVKLLKHFFKPNPQAGSIMLPSHFRNERDNETNATSYTKAWNCYVSAKKEARSDSLVSVNKYNSLQADEDILYVEKTKNSTTDSEESACKSGIWENADKETISDRVDLDCSNSKLPMNTNLTEEGPSQVVSKNKRTNVTNAAKDRILGKLQKLTIAYTSSHASSSSNVGDPELFNASKESTEANIQLVTIPMKNHATSACSPVEDVANTSMAEKLKELQEEVLSLQKKEAELKREVERLRHGREEKYNYQIIYQLKERVKELESKLDPSTTLGHESLNKFLDECSVESEKLIYLIGGYDGCSWLRSLDSYLLSLDIQTPLRQMILPRSYGAAAALDGRLFVFGGGFERQWYNSVECYDPRNDEWISCPALARERGCLAGASLNGSIFAIGGGDGMACFSDVEMFDPVLGRWIYCPSMFKKRFATAAVSLNGSLYAVGGFDGQNYLSSAERFDPREVCWTPIASMKSKRGSHSLVALNEKLYACGGYNGDQMTSSVEVFDSRAGAWMEAESMNVVRGYASAAVLGDSLFVLGGLKDSADLVDVVECYREGTGWTSTSLKAVGTRCCFSAIVL